MAGWSYQWITQLSWAADSPTAPVDVRRIPPDADAIDATIAQIRDLVEQLGDDGPVPLFVFDAGYDPIALGAELGDTRAAVLVRIRSDQVFYADPAPAPLGTAGRPRRHGDRFACADADSWPAPYAELVTTILSTAGCMYKPGAGCIPSWPGAAAGPTLDVPPIVRGAVIRVEVPHLPEPTGRAKKTLWLWWSGPGAPDLEVCWKAYLRRFDIEHTYRFSKHTLGWTTPAVRTPEQADRWTWLISPPTPSCAWLEAWSIPASALGAAS